jgi:uncharacterized membrane protein
VQPPPHPSAHAMGLVLRIGTSVSTALLVVGIVLALAVPQTWAADPLLTAGLIILMATPVAHLLVALVDEITAREWGFVAIGLAVLTLLGGSLVVAFS